MNDSNHAPSPAPAGRGLLGSRAARVAVGAGLLTVVALGPALVETNATHRLQAALGSAARVDLDAAGLRVAQLSLVRGRTTFTAEECVLHPTASGIAVHVAGPQMTYDAAPRPASTAPPAAAPTRPARPPGSVIPNTYGIPVTVTVAGALSLSASGVTATIVDPTAHLDGHGGAIVQADAEVRLADGTVSVATRGPLVARHTGAGWTAQAMISVAGGPAIAAGAAIGTSLTGADGTLWIDDGHGGQLRAERRDGTTLARLQRFAVSTLGSLASAVSERFGVQTDGVLVDGALILEHHDGTLHASLDPITVSGLVIDDRALSPGVVRFDPVTASGEFSRSAAALSGFAVVTHRGAQVHVAGRLADDAAELDVTLPPVDCQTLLDAAPAGMADVVATAQLRGTVDGHLRVAVDRAALLAARQVGQFDRDAPPGALSFEFPFLERCAVLRDPSGIDFEGLRGPYRHRFVGASGTAHTRVMAPGAAGFIALQDGRLAADALLSLEDYRFWGHDGFDREQIRYAFWHNLVVGRVSRGASTVSQQAARNLWLGVDRSIARKLQEALLTARLEARLDKARILELYLNVIELGPDVHGVQDAARFYFGKDADALTPLQAVHLAALAPAPRRYARDFVDGTVSAKWLESLHEHLRRMRRAGVLTRAQLVAALRSDLALLDRR